MLLTSVLKTSNTNQYEAITTECSEFLTTSEGLPVFKTLPTEYNDFQRVKVRHKKTKDKVANTFNEAFREELPNLSQRAVFASGHIVNESASYDPFYIFPINGFKYLYSKEVSNSSKDYKAVIDSMLETFDGDIERTSSIVAEVIRYTYTSKHLSEGIKMGSELIFLDVPYYYAVRCSSIDYNELLSSL
jgi:predicted lactoylglutathione lyase